MRITTSHLPTASSHLRKGLTLAEVLISMGILVVGLLGVASLFPVGGHYMQQGDIADRAGAIAQAALDDAIVRGHLNPENWVVHNISASPYKFMELVSGKAIRGNGVEETATGLRQSIAENNGTVYSVPKNSGVLFRSALHGEAFVIDPLGLAAVMSDQPEPDRLITRIDHSTSLRHFPGIALQVKFTSPQWNPWEANGVVWPVRRVTTVHRMQGLNGSVSFKLQEPLASKLFTTSDDLALIMPDNGDDPTRGRWETWTNNSISPQAAARQSRGDYSWIISVSPGSSEARDALATQPDAFQYDVSAVVFYKRDLGHGYAGALEAERLVQAKVVSTGTAGGELLLERFYPSTTTGFPTGAPDEPNLSPFEDLRAGEYVLLTGPHPLSTDNRPMLFTQWYRVLTIEDSGSPNLKGTTLPLNRENRVLVSLRGPDWPWEPGTNLSNNVLSNDLRVTVIPGAVAVHTKTMRLESGSAWGE